VEKCCRAGQTTDNNMAYAYCISIACCILKVTNTHSYYVILIFYRSNGYTNAAQCYDIRTLPLLFVLSIISVFRSLWTCGLRRGAATAWLLGSLVRSSVVHDNTWHSPDKWETTQDQNVPYKRLQGMRQERYPYTPSECGQGKPMWEWTRKVIARILRTIPARIHSDWFLRPQFYLWPP